MASYQDVWDILFCKSPKINNLQADNNKIDERIDQIFYDLYGLTQEEIKIVENAP